MLSSSSINTWDSEVAKCDLVDRQTTLLFSIGSSAREINCVSFKNRCFVTSTAKPPFWPRDAWLTFFSTCSVYSPSAAAEKQSRNTEHLCLSEKPVFMLTRPKTKQNPVARISPKFTSCRKSFQKQSDWVLVQAEATLTSSRPAVSTFIRFAALHPDASESA